MLEIRQADDTSARAGLRRAPYCTRPGPYLMRVVRYNKFPENLSLNYQNE